MSLTFNQRMTGFSLVEIMVGMVIGLLGFLVIMQVFSFSESRNKTTIAGDDAQNGGAIALYGLQRDIRISGFGITAPSIIGCNLALPGGWTLNSLAPVTINHASIPAGDPNTDTLLIVYGNANSTAEGDVITAQPGGAIYTVQTPTSFNANDSVISQAQARPTPCNLTLNRVVSADVGSGNVTLATPLPGMSNGILFNLGSSPKMLAYAVRNATLTACDYLANDCSLAASVGNSSIWVPIASNIVSLRADYGHDAAGPMDSIVTTYNRMTPTTDCGWLRAPAIRIALVSRSNQRDGSAVTATAPTWSGSAAAPIDLSANSSWQNFRYKTFETLVAIRNLTWQGAASGC